MMNVPSAIRGGVSGVGVARRGVATINTVSVRSSAHVAPVAGGFGFAARRSSGASLSLVRRSSSSSLSSMSSVVGRNKPVVVKAADEEPGASSEAGAGEGGAEQLAFEPKSKSKRKRRTGENTRRAKVNVEGLAIDAAKGVAPVTVQSASEEAYILFLLGYVVVIFLGGLLLAISAFGVLPDALEGWVENSLYPAYSPTVVGFLAFSSIYGVIKTRNDPNSAS